MHRRTMEAFNRRSFAAVTGAREVTEAGALGWWTPRPLWGHGADTTGASKRRWFASTTDGALDDPSTGRGNLYEIHVRGRGPEELSLAALVAGGASAVNSQLWPEPPEYPYLESRPVVILGRNAKIAKMTMDKSGIDAWDVWWNEPGPSGWTITTHVLVGTAHYSDDEAVAFARSLTAL